MEIKNMEQKRRTMNAAGTRKKKGKKVWKVLGIIVALGLIFFLSYKISYGLLSDGSKPSTNATQSTEEDIASMTREELEKSYKDAKKQLEEKDAEIEMLKEKISKGDSASTPSESVKPSESPKPSESAKPSESPKTQETKKPTEAPKQTPAHTTAPSTGNSAPATPPPATKAPSDQLMTPDDLANLPGASGN